MSNSILIEGKEYRAYRLHDNGIILVEADEIGSKWWQNNPYVDTFVECDKPVDLEVLTELERLRGILNEFYRRQNQEMIRELRRWVRDGCPEDDIDLTRDTDIYIAALLEEYDSLVAHVQREYEKKWRDMENQ